MCLLVLAIGQDPDYPLILLGNRDEFHARPTQDAAWWTDKPDIVGGRDLQAGGTWLALSRAGRIATVTNFRDGGLERPGRRSRGHLVTDFLHSPHAPTDYLRTIDESRYAGFNLLVADRHSVAFHSNRDGAVRELPAGVYGLSNAELDTPWHKVRRSKAALSALLEQGRINETTLMRILDDREKAPVSEVVAEHMPFSRAHALTAPFITSPDYGTRCSTIVLQHRDGPTRFLERRYDPTGTIAGESRYSIAADG